MSMSRLRVALAKGRLYEPAVALLRPGRHRRRSRAGPPPADPLERPRDRVPGGEARRRASTSESGAADLGVTGTDVLRETDADVLEPLELGFGACRLVVASPGDRAFPDLPGGKTARVATKYPRLAWRHFAEPGRPVEIITVNGSVEVAPLLGLAHWIVDLVDTGNTLRANGLVGAGDDPAGGGGAGRQPRQPEAQAGSASAS